MFMSSWNSVSSGTTGFREHISEKRREHVGLWLNREIGTEISETAAAETVEFLTDELSKQVEKWKGISMSDLFDTYMPIAADYLLRAVLAIVIFLIGRKLINKAVRLCTDMMERHGLEITVCHFLRNVLYAIGYLMLVMILFQTVGITVTSIAAIFASVGVAAGLALQGSLSNFAGGVLILLLKPFVIGDYIVQGSNEGTVKEIGLVYTKLRTLDNRLVLIPNGTLADSSVVNVTANPTRQLDLIVGIGYQSDLRKAKELLRELAMSDPARLSDQPIEVFVSELADSSVNLGLRLWVLTEEYWKTKWRLTEQIKLTFDREGIEIPYRKVDVQLIGCKKERPACEENGNVQKTKRG